jgi:hypothetical protein
MLDKSDPSPEVKLSLRAVSTVSNFLNLPISMDEEEFQKMQVSGGISLTPPQK